MEEEDWLESCGGLEEDWQVVEKALPVGWEMMARQTGALVRKKGFKAASNLLRVLLIHLDGSSLRETSVRSEEGGLAAVSDVAILNRLRKAGEWFRWMAEELVRETGQAPTALLADKRVRLVDGSVICEPGATGSTWRLHYAINLSTLRCEEVHVTTAKEGESLTRYDAQVGDVLIGDRGLAHRRGIRHVIERGGDVIVRLNLDNVPLEDASGEPFALLPHLRSLSYDQPGDWLVQTRDAQGVMPLKVCAIKKSEKETRRAQDKLRKAAKKKGRKVKPETLEAAGYVFVLTTLSTVAATTILELYRCRWQIEMAFKRLKSLLQLGHLKKTDPEAAKAWLQGKLLIAALIEKLIAMGERFSPWGYLSSNAEGISGTLLLAGNDAHALPAQPRDQSSAIVAGRVTPLEQHRGRIARTA